MTSGMIYETIAAVDLGSNSFRLQVGRIVDNQIYPLDSLKSAVRLASGLDANKMLDTAAQHRALEALALFGERLRGLDAGAVRAVATNTWRVAKNAPDFLPAAEQALGFPIEIIAGREEARLIYIGVSHALPAASHKRLVFDIGGGSTEFIIGQQDETLLLESLHMGCVSYTQRFFPDGRVDKHSFREAQIAASKEVELIAHDYRQTGWAEAIGSSGTAKAIAELLEVNHMNPAGRSGISRSGLEQLCQQLIKAGRAEAMGISGLRGDRLPVLSGGMAILSAIFNTLALEHVTYADGALRQGVLYDLLGRFHHQDMRETTVAQFTRRYQVDRTQAERVRATALLFQSQLLGVADENEVLFLDWAARLHEIGISVAHNGYHKHGAYILTFADMPGFSKKEQARLAMLVLGHRGKLEKVAGVGSAGDSTGGRTGAETKRGEQAASSSAGKGASGIETFWLTLFSLRLAVLMHRGRDDRALPACHLRVIPGASGTSGGVLLELPRHWLEDNPLTASALEEEIQAWKRIGRDFRLRARNPD